MPVKGLRDLCSEAAKGKELEVVDTLGSEPLDHLLIAVGERSENGDSVDEEKAEAIWLLEP